MVSTRMLSKNSVESVPRHGTATGLHSYLLPSRWPKCNVTIIPFWIYSEEVFFFGSRETIVSLQFDFHA